MLVCRFLLHREYFRRATTTTRLRHFQDSNEARYETEGAILDTVEFRHIVQFHHLGSCDWPRGQLLQAPCLVQDDAITEFDKMAEFECPVAPLVLEHCSHDAFPLLDPALEV